MALTVADIMDADVPRSRRDDDVETVVHLLREPRAARASRWSTRAALRRDHHRGRPRHRRRGGRDLHLPHYIELFGGVVFLEPLRHFEDRLRKAFASTVEDMMTADPITIEPDASVREAAG